MLAALGGCASAGAPTVERDAVTAMRALPPDTAPPPPADGMSPAFHAAFALADQRARRLLYAQQCTAAVLTLRARGRLGPAASAPRTVHCARTADGIPLGGVYEVDSSFTRVRRLTVLRLDGAQPRWTAPLDTAAIARAAKLARDAEPMFRARYRLARRAYQPFTITLDDGTLEAWALPAGGGGRAVTLGGEMGIARRPDGTTVPLADRVAAWRAWTPPAAGVAEITSREADVAGVQELVVARRLAELGRDVRVRTPTAASTLAPGQDPSGSRFTWTHGPAAAAR